MAVWGVCGMSEVVGRKGRSKGGKGQAHKATHGNNRDGPPKRPTSNLRATPLPLLLLPHPKSPSPPLPATVSLLIVSTLTPSPPPRRSSPVHGAQLRQPQRQVAVAVVAVLVDGHVEGAVHGPQLVRLVLHLGRGGGGWAAGMGMVSEVEQFDSLFWGLG